MRREDRSGKRRKRVPLVRKLAGVTAALAVALAGSAPASAALGYEQVTPVDKGGVEPGLVQAARVSSGADVVQFGTNYTMPGTEPHAGPYAPSYVARRGTSNWSTTALDPMLSNPFNPQGAFYTLTMGISRDGSRAIVMSQQVLAAGGTEGALNLYRRDLASDNYRWMASDTTNPNPFEIMADLAPVPPASVVGATPDFSRVWINMHEGVRLSNDPADPGGQLQGAKLYEWSEEAGIQLVSRKPVGPPFEGAAFERYFRPAFETYAAPRNPNVVSADGRQVLLHEQGAGWPPAPDEWGLYVRWDGVTRPLSYSRATGADGTARAVRSYAASVDGRYVAFVGRYAEPLTDDAPEGDPNPTFGYGGLYVWDREQPAAEQLTSISVPGFDGTQIVQILQMSDDGRTLYLEHAGTLYVWRDATVREVVASDGWGPQGSPTLSLANALGASDGAYQASPSGRFFVFPSAASLTGADLRNPSCTYEDWSWTGLDGYCVEQYVYDAQTDEIACASCSVDGRPSRGPAGATSSRMFANDLRARPIVFDSGKVLFDTPNALVPEDANASRDVYAYEAGRHTLISRAALRTSARLLTATDDGQTTLIVTDDPIVLQDTDRSRDIYLVREGAGLAAQQRRPDDGARCAGSDCREAVPPPAAGTPPGTAGPGARSDAPRGRPASMTLRATLRTVAPRRKHAQLVVRLGRSASGARVRISGSGVRATTRQLRDNGRYVVSVPLNARSQRTLRQRKRLRLQLRVTASPAFGASRTVRVNKTVRSGR